MDQFILGAAISAGAVTLAEMGDKTQLLAMAFATRYKASRVLMGVFIATVFNHALAVALGTFLTRYETISAWIQLAAALSFIGFGLWTIRGDRLEGEENRVSRFGPVGTVAIAFFLAEMGDKTQLTTIALAAKFPDVPAAILAGTTTGMLIADSIGIIVGVVMCRNIPAKTIKLVSAGIFMLFGFLGTWESLRSDFSVNLPIASMILLALLAATAFCAVRLVRNEKESGAFAPDVSGGHCSVSGFEAAGGDKSGEAFH